MKRKMVFSFTTMTAVVIIWAYGFSVANAESPIDGKAFYTKDISEEFKAYFTEMIPAISGTVFRDLAEYHGISATELVIGTPISLDGGTSTYYRK